MSTRAEQDAEATASGGLTHRQIVTILIGLMMGMFLAALDQTVVATATRTIADDLNGLSIQAWVTTAYLITATVSTPLYGKLSDLYGRKRFFLAAILIFMVGSILCTIAQSMYELAAFRAVQGLGAGGLFSLALAIVGDIVSPRQRAKYQGYFLAVFGTSSVLGPVVGGVLAGQDQILNIAGWRWVFLVNVPVGLVALAVVAKVLNIPHTRREHRIDWPGAIALCICVVPILIVAEQMRTWGWDSERAIICYAVGGVGLLLFILAEWRIGSDALLPLRFFRSSVFSVGTIAGLIVGMGMFAGIALLPLYLQIVKGASPTEAGLLLIPLTLGIMVASIISGQVISRTGRYKIFPVIGCLLMAAGLVLLGRIGVDTSLPEVSAYMAIFGLGLGGNMQPLMLAMQNAVPPRDIGAATAATTFFRQMGGTLGTAAFMSVLFSTVTANIADAFRSAAGTESFQAALRDPSVLNDPANAPVLSALQNGGAGGLTLDDSSFITNLDPRLARPILTGYSESLDLTFLIAAGVVGIAFLVVLFLREVPLKNESGLQAQAAEDQAAAEAAAGASTVAVAEEALPVADPRPAAPVAVPRTEVDPNADPRDRLLSLWVPAPGAAVDAVERADVARAQIERLRSELATHEGDFETAVRQLRALGLTPDQIAQVVGDDSVLRSTSDTARQAAPNGKPAAFDTEAAAASDAHRALANGRGRYGPPDVPPAPTA